MKEICIKDTRKRVSKVREILKSAGNQIGAAHFIKRDGTKRKMAYRLRVQSPTYASKPKGSKPLIDPKKHNIMTVFDVNSIRYNKQGRMNGRGNWRSIPLEGVYRLKVGGTIYHFIS